MITLKVLDPVWTKVTGDIKLLKPCLSYDKVFFKRGPWKATRKTYKKFLISKGLMLTGFVPRVKKFCKENRIDCAIKEIRSEIIPNAPRLKGREARPYQKKQIEQALKKHRGVIWSATASGKTTVMMGIVSAFPDHKVLVLSNTHTPLSQFKVNMAVYLPDRVKDVEISTIQSFYRKNPDEYTDKYDVILIDECHEGIRSFDKGMYQKVLKRMTAPIRIGFTGTVPPDTEAKLALEGFLGPVIGRYSIKQGTREGILAKPVIKIRKVPFSHKVKQLRRYDEVYKKGVVESRPFNRLVAKDIWDFTRKGKSVLVLVTEISHGKNIVRLAKQIYGMKVPLVRGETKTPVRDEIQKLLTDKKVKAIVATAVFKKALDVPSLDIVIDACQEKSEVMTLQMIGRGLRTTTNKKQVIIVDYFNPSHHYLVDHFGHRLILYLDNKWL